jgi:carbon storage regulator
MLVLSRKPGEQLRIGDNIVVTINRVSGDKVSVGIEAPRNVKVMRGEIPPPEQSDSDGFRYG